MIKAIIFDLNGIFIKSRKLGDRFEEDFNIPTSVFLPELFKIMGEVRKPNSKPAFTYWEPLFKKWNLNLNEEKFWNYWFKEEYPSEEMISFSKELKEKGIKIFMLSNNFKERAEHYGHYPWMQKVVDKAYFSWQTGFIKPNLEAWKLVLSENNLNPEECLYFDDKEENVKASEEVKIKAFVFTDESELKKIVHEHIK